MPTFDLIEGFKKLALLYIPILSRLRLQHLVFYMQHQHDPNYKAWKEDWQYLLAAIKGSSYYKLPKFFNFFTGNIGYHHIHHLAPKVPFYKLENAARESYFPKICDDYYVIKQCKICFYTLWDEEITE